MQWHPETGSGQCDVSETTCLHVCRASSLSGGEALGSTGARRRRSAPGASPLVQGTPQALLEEESGTPDSQSAETFPRSFKIQRSGSADSLASLVSLPFPLHVTLTCVHVPYTARCPSSSETAAQA